MKFMMIVSLFTTILFAEVYYSKVEPMDIRDISSNVSGLVLKVDEDLLGEKLSSQPYIIIDSKLDKYELTLLRKKIAYLKDIVSANENILANLKKSLKRKQDNYEKIKSLKIKSSIEKNKEFYELNNSKNLFLNTQKEILNLKIQIADLSLKYSQLQRTIKDKTLVADGFVLYKLLVKAGKVVSKSTPLAQIADISKAKLTIYLNKDDIKDVKNKTVFINSKPTDYKITRVIKIADTKNISKYKAQIIIKAPKIFSNLVKVELK